MNRVMIIALSCSMASLTAVSGENAFGTSLYRCVTEAEGTTYTDSPTQLDQCTPIPTSGAVTSLATTSSGNQSAPPQPMTQPTDQRPTALPAPSPPMPPSGPSQA
jgi:hypothetical protein